MCLELGESGTRNRGSEVNLGSMSLCPISQKKYFYCRHTPQVWKKQSSRRTALNFTVLCCLYSEASADRVVFDLEFEVCWLRIFSVSCGEFFLGGCLAFVLHDGKRVHFIFIYFFLFCNCYDTSSPRRLFSILTLLTVVPDIEGGVKSSMFFIRYRRSNCCAQMDQN